MSKQLKVLLVEDDPNFGQVLQSFMKIHKYDVTWAQDGNVGLSYFKSQDFDLCLLDVMMPYKDGFTLAEEIRKLNQDVHLIFLTAKSMKDDVLKGYGVGADDYLVKPFDSEVLIAKINALFRRGCTKIEEQHEFQIGQFSFNYNTRKLHGPNEERKLSPKEADLMKLICEHQNKVLPRELALNQIWKEDSYFTTRSMDVYIAKIRKYLKDDPNIEIVNLHGKGFEVVASRASATT